MSFRPTANERSVNPRPRVLRFDSYKVDLESGELYRDGRRIHLQAQPMQLLTLLLRNPGELVTRETVRGELWPVDTFVDFDRSLATAVNKIREALGDSAEVPKFIETLPKRGYRFIGELLPAENDSPPLVVLEGKSPALQPPERQQQRDADTPRKTVRLKPLAWVLVGAAAALAIYVGVERWRSARTFQNDAPLAVVPFTAYQGNAIVPAFSPDGSMIAFAWDGGNQKEIDDRPNIDLYVKALHSESLLQLTHHGYELVSPAWSPDGTQIAYHRSIGDDTGIYVVPALGGEEHKLVTTHIPYDLAAAISWSPDGKWIAYDDIIGGKPGDRMFMFSMETHESRQFPHDPACAAEASLTFAHDNKQVAYVCVHNIDWLEVFTADRNGNNRRSVLSYPYITFGLAWTHNDEGLLISQQTGAGFKLVEVRLKDRVARELPVSPAGMWPSLSASGDKLAFASQEQRINLWRRDLKNPTVPPMRMYPYNRNQDQGEYSPDGKRIVFISTIRGQSDAWVSDADGSNLVQISTAGNANNPHWAPDSRHLVFDANDTSGNSDIYVVDIDERIPRKLSTNVARKAHPSFSHDGKWIYFRGYEKLPSGKVTLQLYRCPAQGGDATILATGGDPASPRESADGRTLYFLSREVAAAVRQLPLDSTPAIDTEVEGMNDVRHWNTWSVAATGIYFIQADQPTTAYFYDLTNHQKKELFKADKALMSGISVSPDGRYILYGQIDQIATSIQLVEHFR
jgi:Tol biopolymer transport system component/DNA-binding winged helix-turn-helix (wHTH) protein